MPLWVSAISCGVISTPRLGALNQPTEPSDYAVLVGVYFREEWIKKGNNQIV